MSRLKLINYDIIAQVAGRFEMKIVCRLFIRKKINYINGYLLFKTITLVAEHCIPLLFKFKRLEISLKTKSPRQQMAGILLFLYSVADFPCAILSLADLVNKQRLCTLFRYGM